jgi:hypothetical protein
MDVMTSHSLTELETPLDTLDQDTAQRVTRLVAECSVSPALALLAVEDANRSMYKEERQSRPRRTVAGILAALWAQ